MTFEDDVARVAAASVRTGLQYRDGDGRLWWDAKFATHQLGVTRENLYDWVRRSRTDPRFPKVDPPRRSGNVAAYLAEQLIEAEAYTAAASRGRIRRSSS